MYERFTDRARKIMQLANQEAARFQHEYIGTEHILLGMIREGAGVAGHVLNSLGLDYRAAKKSVENLLEPGPPLEPMGKLPITPRAKKVIEYAMEESRNLGHGYVGTEHLLLGLLREGEGVAAQVLVNAGMTQERVRAEVLRFLGVENPATEEAEPERETIAIAKPDRRLARVHISLEDLAVLLRLSESAKILGVRQLPEFAGQTLELFVEDERYPEVRRGCVAPVVMLDVDEGVVDESSHWRWQGG